MAQTAPAKKEEAKPAAAAPAKKEEVKKTDIKSDAKAAPAKDTKAAK
jgi:hypothetical protein